MAGTKAGGEKAAKYIKNKYGQDFYQKIGAIGGRIGTTGGFYRNRKLASEMGKIGGLNSRRNGIKNRRVA